MSNLTRLQPLISDRAYSALEKLDQTLETLQPMSLRDLEDLKGIGEVGAKEIREALDSLASKEMVAEAPVVQSATGNVDAAWDRAMALLASAGKGTIVGDFNFALSEGKTKAQLIGPAIAVLKDIDGGMGDRGANLAASVEKLLNPRGGR